MPSLAGLEEDGEPLNNGNENDSPTARKFFGFYLLIFLVSVVVVIRLVDLQIVQGQANYSLAKGNQLRTEPIPAQRGLIYDTNGTALVANIPNYSLILDITALPTNSAKRTKILTDLASIIGKSPATLLAQVNGTRAAQLTLADHLEHDQALKLQLEFGQKDINGITLTALPMRQYNQTVPDLGHLLGYIGKITESDAKARPELLPTSYVGKNGLEKQYDTKLQGTPGITTYEVNAAGQVIRLVGSQPSVPGSSLVLALNASLQQVAANALQTGISLNNAKAGAAVAMNVQTGQLLAMVSNPSFDNNLFSNPSLQDQISPVLTNPGSPLLNRAIAGQYPSGSTIKPFVAAAALQEGIINAGTKFDTSQPITVGQQTFHDWTKHGISNVSQAIAQSNDIFFYSIGGGHGNIGGLGINKLNDYLQKFGFDQKTGIDLPGETAGNVPSPSWKEKTQNQPWYLGDTYNLSIGQGGLLVTPLQLVNATSAVANGGTLYRPTMIKSIVDANGSASDAVPMVIRNSIVSNGTIQTVQQGMRAAVGPGGSAHSILGGLPVDTAAKTGTAQIGTSLTNTHAWFTAYAPYQNPQIAVSVIVEGGGEGYDVSGPIVRQIIEQYFNLPLTPIVAAPAGQ